MPFTNTHIIMWDIIKYIQVEKSEFERGLSYVQAVFTWILLKQ